MPTAAVETSTFDESDNKFSDENMMLFEYPIMFRGENNIKLCNPETDVIPPDPISKYELSLIVPWLGVGSPVIK
jgi:hypothetical protein